MHLILQKRATCDWPHNADCKPSIMEYAEAYFLNNQQRQQTSLIVANNKTGWYSLIFS